MANNVVDKLQFPPPLFSLRTGIYRWPRSSTPPTMDASSLSPSPLPPLIARIWRHAALPRYFSWFRWWIVKKKKNASDGPRAINFRWPERRRYALPPSLPSSPYIGAYYPRIGVSASSSFFLFLSFSPPSPLFVRFFRNSRSIWTEHRTPAFIGACVYTRTKRPLHGRRSIYRQPRPIFLFPRWIDNVSSFADQFVSPRN